MLNSFLVAVDNFGKGMTPETRSALVALLFSFCLLILQDTKKHF